MTTAPDLSVREYDPADRSFMGWTLRSSARRALQYNPMREDTSLDHQVEQTARLIERRSREAGWIVLVASWRGERCGLLISPPTKGLGDADLGIPGEPATRSGARVYVDRWYTEMGVEPALDEAADLARQASGPRRGAPRGGPNL